MSEEEANGVKDQETAKPEAKSEDNSQSQALETREGQELTEGSKEYNFARLREKAESADKKNAKLEREVRELREAFEKKNAPAPSEEEDELARLAPDDIVTVEQAYKLSERQAKKIVQEVIEKQEKATLPDKARSQFTDFDTIMTEDNIKKLETEEPGLAAACAKAPNPWEATYKILKKFVIVQKDVSGNKGDAKMKENLSKPASANSVGRQGPLSDANSWSEASKDDLYKEMMQSARKVR